ncbi:MAG: hydrogenase expression/formation protein [Alphaproteobacteria bacterium]|nr:hydrogenase expression/formation protein [Rhizobiaceae bacterium]MBU3962817.1 hydrogenase expression/formation protein [Alphaproteobacteria bacterium]MBU4051543.1 hydrogenase expression/formation protein [Alphaproteobacteria bacterium]MBU4090743.1 hydrogenase expression/formation protein [Alphaproteobacteria bacterium]MBU4156299.1 hydrogenase expression/formation protein [Alphaproteobacteria bacterium]
MKAGFWVAPEGDDATMTVMPIGAEPPLRTRKLNYLATSSAEEMIRRCRQTAELLPRIADALATQKADEPGQLFDITDFAADDKELITQTLGEGEVAGVAALANGVLAQIQEAVMAGVWRVRFTDANGTLLADYVEVASIPAAVRQACAVLAPEIVHGPAPTGAMNVMPVLHEIGDRIARYKDGDEPHIITFSLFPMSPEDMTFLQQTLGAGPVQLTSRGYGTCRVVATGARNVWSVQFYNAMDTIILDTLEICDIPSVAIAAEEDFRDSEMRLREIEEAYFK